MKGFGGVVSFEIGGGFETTVKFVGNLKLCFLAASLEGTENLYTTCNLLPLFHSVDDRKNAGVKNQLMRLALGVEDSEDIIADLDQAFHKI